MRGRGQGGGIGQGKSSRCFRKIPHRALYLPKLARRFVSGYRRRPRLGCWNRWPKLFRKSDGDHQGSPSRNDLFGPEFLVGSGTRFCQDQGRAVELVVKAFCNAPSARTGMTPICARWGWGRPHRRTFLTSAKNRPPATPDKAETWVNTGLRCWNRCWKFFAGLRRPLKCGGSRSDVKARLLGHRFLRTIRGRARPAAVALFSGAAKAGAHYGGTTRKRQATRGEIHR